MRFSVAVLAVLASTASAFNLSPRQSLPTCVVNCIGNADFDGCEPTDNSCLCHSQKFVSSTTVCIGNTCQGNDLQAALVAAQQLCAAVGVTLTATPSGFPSTGTPSASGGATTPTTTTAPSGTASGSNSGSSSSGSSSGNAAVMNGVNPLTALAALGLIFVL